MKWTDQDMEKFAVFCGRQAEAGFNPSTGIWYLDDINCATTKELLELYRKQQIPLSLPSVDDLSSLHFGPNQNSEIKY